MIARAIGPINPVSLDRIAAAHAVKDRSRQNSANFHVSISCRSMTEASPIFRSSVSAVAMAPSDKKRKPPHKSSDRAEIYKTDSLTMGWMAHSKTTNMPIGKVWIRFDKREMPATMNKPAPQAKR